MRKHLFLLTLLFVLLSQVNSQVLFTYGDQPVSKQEFLTAYNKNRDVNQGKGNTFNNYLQLYIAYKLKVQAAKDLKMDTLAGIKADINSFKNQVEDNYLFDKNQVDALLQQAFDRSQKDIHVISYFVDTTSLSNNGKTLADIKNTFALIKKAKKSEIDKIISGLSSAGSKISISDLGYITAFTLPYPIENIIYQLKPGDISDPYPTSSGFYLFKNEKERPAAGRIKVAQILISAGPQDRSGPKRIADSIYNLLLSGADFATLAKQESFDRMSAGQGGVLEEFGVGKYIPAFENQAFSLIKDNEISKPFETAFGFHILKRISITPVHTSKDDQGFMYELRNKVLNDKSRMAEENKLFLQNILKKTGYTKKSVNEKNVWIVTDSSLMENKNITSGNVNEKTVLFTFNDHSVVNTGDWIQFVRKSEKAIPGRSHESYKQLMPDFIDSSVRKNYKKRLTEFDPVFNQQLNQFKDENLLFEIMNKKIWNQASADTAALLNYYNLHKNKYIADTGAPLNSFDEARGFVISDYQDYLEEKWVNDLKKKYPIVINQKVFNSLKR